MICVACRRQDLSFGSSGGRQAWKTLFSRLLAAVAEGDFIFYFSPPSRRFFLFNFSKVDGQRCFCVMTVFHEASKSVINILRYFNSLSCI
jgi:hypothetical protein